MAAAASFTGTKRVGLGIALPAVALTLPDDQDRYPSSPLLAFCINLRLILNSHPHTRPERLGLLLAATLSGVSISVSIGVSIGVYLHKAISTISKSAVVPYWYNLLCFFC